MKKIIALLVFTIVAMVAVAQGINFEKPAEKWTDILDKAKRDNKFIFVDCYATWCGPCKMMDNEVYPKETVGNFMNSNFISVKVQMDTTKSDSPETRAWYKDAHELMNFYSINGFPTFLFFSPDGKIVQIQDGALSESAYIALAKEVIDPQNQQYYSRLQQYNQSPGDFSELNYLIRKTHELKNKALLNTLVATYVKKYLDKQPLDTVLEKRNLDFFRENWDVACQYINPGSHLFNLLKEQGSAFDKAFAIKGFSQGAILHLIRIHAVNPRIWPDGKAVARTPEWEKLYVKIQNSYGQYYANRLVPQTKIAWYTEKKDWHHAIDAHIENMERNGLDTNSYIAKGMTNNLFFSVFFRYGTDKKQLAKAIKWMKAIIDNQREPVSSQGPGEWMDTYANLLYKTGRRNDAVSWEKKAIESNQASCKANGHPEWADKSLPKNLDKMLKGEPTWDN